MRSSSHYRIPSSVTWLDTRSSDFSFCYLHQHSGANPCVCGYPIIPHSLSFCWMSHLLIPCLSPLADQPFIDTWMLLQRVEEIISTPLSVRFRPPVCLSVCLVAVCKHRLSATAPESHLPSCCYVPITTLMEATATFPWSDWKWFLRSELVVWKKSTRLPSLKAQMLHFKSLPSCDLTFSFDLCTGFESLNHWGRPFLKCSNSVLLLLVQWLLPSYKSQDVKMTISKDYTKRIIPEDLKICNRFFLKK